MGSKGQEDAKKGGGVKKNGARQRFWKGHAGTRGGEDTSTPTFRQEGEMWRRGSKIKKTLGNSEDLDPHRQNPVHRGYTPNREKGGQNLKKKEGGWSNKAGCFNGGTRETNDFRFKKG